MVTTHTQKELKQNKKITLRESEPNQDKNIRKYPQLIWPLNRYFNLIIISYPQMAPTMCILLIHLRVLYDKTYIIAFTMWFVHSEWACVQMCVWESIMILRAHFTSSGIVNVLLHWLFLLLSLEGTGFEKVKTDNQISNVHMHNFM